MQIATCYRYGMSDYNLRWHYNTVAPRYIPAILPLPRHARASKKQASRLDRTIESSIRRSDRCSALITRRRVQQCRTKRGECVNAGRCAHARTRATRARPSPHSGRCRAITRMRVTSNANYLFISLRMQPRRHAASDKGGRPLKLLRAPAFVHARPRPDNCADYKNVRPRLARLYRYRPSAPI